MLGKIKWIKTARNDFKSEPEKDVLLRVAKLNDGRWWYACYFGNFEVDQDSQEPINEKDAKTKCIEVYKKHKYAKENTKA